MDFRFDQGVPILRRTPSLLRALLEDLDLEWTDATEGPGKWTPFDVVGHLVHGDHANWIPRIEHLLHHEETLPFPPFDREAMFTASRGLSIGDLLDRFEGLRAESLVRLEGLRLTDADLSRRGKHPDFGAVTLGQLLATW